jgi:thymidylate kinase
VAVAVRRLELIGIPGSGKSTLAEEAARWLNGRGRRAFLSEDLLYPALRARMEDRLLGPLIRVLPQRLGRSVASPLFARSADRSMALGRFVLAHPGTARAVLAGLGRRREAPAMDRVLGWILNLFATHDMAERNLDIAWFAVLDEGFANRAVSVFGDGFGPRDGDDLVEYARSVPPPELLLHVTADPELCEKRLARRGWSERTREMDESARRRFLLDSERAADETVRLLESRGVPVARVGNQGELPEAVTTMTTALERLLGSTDQPAGPNDPPPASNARHELETKRA